jgi:hypothetical protein
VSAALFAACEIIPTHEENARYEWQQSRKNDECGRYGDGQADGAAACVTGQSEQKNWRNITSSLPCHGSSYKEVYDADERDNLFSGVPSHLGDLMPYDGGGVRVDGQRWMCK